ncbi:hypothetical protein TL16_g03751 [Triparma laevis f. inornata]|uniref:Imidazoleglycerol-phosphate dehydratase n=1 Tax=Triparma laevis f. inornata TaxID=1714386 RepID=A0A9W7A635_9STRA|nr:hypothetical protein TL16_g03751 [Triparma laevis f. inornata]
MASFVETIKVSAHDNTNPDPNEWKSQISTGVGFFDHMLDQIQSHGLISLSVTTPGFLLETSSPSAKKDMINRHVDSQEEISSTIGTKLGSALIALLPPSTSLSPQTFYCPLDESLVRCTLTPSTSPTLTFNVTTPTGGLGKFNRTKVGVWNLPCIKTFFKKLAQTLNVTIEFELVTGDNSHHIIESSFKSFSRCLRRLIDAPSQNRQNLPHSVFYGTSGTPPSSKTHEISRQTKETNINVTLTLYPSPCVVSVSTGLPQFDSLLSTLFLSSNISADIKCNGDLWIDDHHLIEDVGISVGKCLLRVLGDKKGMNRMFWGGRELGGWWI